MSGRRFLDFPGQTKLPGQVFQICENTETRVVEMFGPAGEDSSEGGGWKATPPQGA